MMIIVITPETTIAYEANWANQLLHEGLDCLHVRKPLFNEEAMRRYIGQLDPNFYPKMVVHGYPTLVAEYGLRGVHLRKEQLNTEEIQGCKAVVSCSAHSLHELRELDMPFREIFISPLYDSLSKKGYTAKPNLLTLGKLERKSKWMALGGIQQDNIRQVKQHGFDGAALLGYIWQHTDPLKQFITVQDSLKGTNESSK